MRTSTLTLAIVGSVALSGCAAYGDRGLLGDILGGGSDYGYDARTSFERDAVQACGREAERYGRVTVTSAREENRDYVYVYGRIDSRDSRNDEFTCVYSSDRRIVDFRTR